MAINKTGNTILRYDGNIVRYFSQTALIGSVYSQSGKYVGITSASNGKLYCAPFNATQVLEIDPVTGTTTLIGSVYAGTYKYVGITSASNGKLYCAPFNAYQDPTQVLEIDPVTGTTALIGSVYAGNYKYVGILEIDPVTGTTTLIGSVLAGNYKYGGITSAANGKLYCAPHAANQVLEINSVGTFNLFSEFFGFDEFGAPSTIYMNRL
jgi:streptogramin lyase